MRRAPESRLLETDHGHVTVRWDPPSPPRRLGLKAILFLGHGAGSRLDHPTMVDLTESLGSHGYGVVRFNFPYAQSGRRRPDREPVLLDTWLRVWEKGLSGRRFPGVPRLAAGRSMGGRMASLAAARHPERFDPAGLVLFAYPLHPPGRPDRLRMEHLAGIGVPMLFLSGTRDEFASGNRLERAVFGIPRAEIRRLDGADHSFRVLRRSGRRDEDVMAEAMAALDDWFVHAGFTARGRMVAGSPGKGVSP